MLHTNDRSESARGKAPLNDSDEAIIYARVSTREQARTGGGEEGYSIPYQREACRSKAKRSARSWWTST